MGGPSALKEDINDTSLINLHVYAPALKSAAVLGSVAPMSRLNDFVSCRWLRSFEGFFRSVSEIGCFILYPIYPGFS